MDSYAFNALMLLVGQQEGQYLAKLQARAWFLVHFVCLANTLLKDEESARDNHFLACKFAKYLPNQKIFSLTD